MADGVSEYVSKRFDTFEQYLKETRDITIQNQTTLTDHKARLDNVEESAQHSRDKISTMEGRNSILAVVLSGFTAYLVSIFKGGGAS